MQREEYYTRLESSIHSLNRGMKEWLADHLENDLTQAQYYILVLLHDAGALTVSHLAHKLGVTPSAVTTMTDRLVRSGLAPRIRSSPDRRVVTVQLSEDGRRLIGRMREQREQVLHRLFQSLSDEELEQFTRLYERIVRSLSCETGE